MGNMFVQFTNAVHTFYASEPSGAAEDDALMAWVQDHNQRSIPVRVTDLVRAGRFGTLPTLHKRLRLLTACGLLQMAVGVDRRSRVVQVSPAGARRLDDRGEMLRMALAET